MASLSFRGALPRAPLLVAAPLVLLLAGCGAEASEEWAPPRVTGGTDVERGRYLAVVGGCNDCHTDGYMERSVPEEQWFLGSPVGWQGPWGTTYAANLRLTVQNMEEDAFVARLRTGTGRPPMPWINVSQMADSDARALYRYLRALGPAGVAMPPALPPGAVPSTPYFSLVPTMPGADLAANPALPGT